MSRVSLFYFYLDKAADWELNPKFPRPIEPQQDFWLWPTQIRSWRWRRRRRRRGRQWEEQFCLQGNKNGFEILLFSLGKLINKILLSVHHMEPIAHHRLSFMATTIATVGVAQLMRNSTRLMKMLVDMTQRRLFANHWKIFNIIEKVKLWNVVKPSVVNYWNFNFALQLQTKRMRNSATVLQL